MVLLHGAGGNADTFRPCLDAWAWADVWCLDLPGRGGSQGPAPRDVSTLAACARDVIEAAGIRPVVVGHSLGGAIGLELALSSPDILEGLVMVSSGARLRVAPEILEAAAGAEVPMRLDFAFANPEAATLERYHHYSDRTPTQATAADWTACNGFDVRDRLDQLRVPLALLWGDDDALTPTKFQRWLADRTGAHTGLWSGLKCHARPSQPGATWTSGTARTLPLGPPVGDPGLDPTCSLVPLRGSRPTAQGSFDAAEYRVWRGCVGYPSRIPDPRPEPLL